jgi:hypothetical protein
VRLALSEPELSRLSHQGEALLSEQAVAQDEQTKVQNWYFRQLSRTVAATCG